MKFLNMISKHSLLALVCLLLLGCKDDEFDGLLNVDPAPDAAVTFPQSVGSNGVPLMDEGAFIIFQNSIAQGRVSVDIKVPEKHQITSISVTAQRFRNGAKVEPNISPTLPTATTDAARQTRAPSVVINRNTAPNLGTNISVTQGSTVTYSIPVNAIPTAISATTLANGQAGASLGALQVNDVIRFFFRVKLADGSEQRAMEVRVVVTG